METVRQIYVHEDKHEATVVTDSGSYSVTEADFLRLKLHSGDMLDGETLDFLAESDEKLRCIKKSFSYLSFGDMSESKLRSKLKGLFSPSAIEKTLVLLCERGYIDDAGYAVKCAEFYASRKGFGLLRIKNELYKKGLSAENIRLAVEYLSDFDFKETAVELAAKKAGERHALTQKEKTSLSAYLYRMGYDYSLISEVVGEYIDG